MNLILEYLKLRLKQLWWRIPRIVIFGNLFFIELLIIAFSVFSIFGINGSDSITEVFFSSGLVVLSFIYLVRIDRFNGGDFDIDWPLRILIVFIIVLGAIIPLNAILTDNTTQLEIYLETIGVLAFLYLLQFFIYVIGTPGFNFEIAVLTLDELEKKRDEVLERGNKPFIVDSHKKEKISVEDITEVDTKDEKDNETEDKQEEILERTNNPQDTLEDVSKSGKEEPLCIYEVVLTSLEKESFKTIEDAVQYLLAFNGRKLVKKTSYGKTVWEIDAEDVKKIVGYRKNK